MRVPSVSVPRVPNGGDHNGTAARRHLLAIPTQRRSPLSNSDPAPVGFVFGCRREATPPSNSDHAAVDFIFECRILFHRLFFFRYESQRIRPNLDLNK